MEDTSGIYSDEPIDIFKNAENFKALNEEIAKEDLLEPEDVYAPWLEGKEKRCMAAVVAVAIAFLFVFF